MNSVNLICQGKNPSRQCNGPKCNAKSGSGNPFVAEEKKKLSMTLTICAKIPLVSFPFLQVIVIQ